MIIIVFVVLFTVLTSCKNDVQNSEKLSLTERKNHKITAVYIIKHIESGDTIRVTVYEDDITSYQYASDKFQIK